DNIFRYLLAGSEVSALLGRMPSAVGYQPTLASEMGELQERITSTRKGSITSVQAVYVPADDYTDPAIQTVFAHLGATLRLQRFLSQPFSVAQRFTGREGKYVPRSETVRGFKEILEGKHDDLPEQAFYMVGTIDEARAQAEEMKKKG